MANIIDRITQRQSAQAKKIDLKQEMQRRSSQRARILALLTSGEYVTNRQLMRVAANYTMRVSELRKDGHRILATYEAPGVFSYAYLGQIDEDDKESMQAMS